MEDPFVTTPRSPRESISDLRRADDWSSRSDRASLINGPNLWMDPVRREFDMLADAGNRTTDGQGLYVFRPVAIDVPWPYDDAGETYPAGSKLVLGGSLLGPQWFNPADSSATQTWDAPIPITSTIVGFVGPKHFFGRWYVALRVPEGSVGTLTLRRSSDWRTLDTSVVLDTVTTEAATDSGEVWVRLPDASAPADLSPASPPTFYLESSWSAGNPESERITKNEGSAFLGAAVLPATLPSGYDLRGMGPSGDLGDPESVPAPLTPYGPGYRQWSMPSRLLGLRASPYSARRVGQASYFHVIADNSGVSTLSSFFYPCVWVGDELKEHQEAPTTFSRMIVSVDADLAFTATGSPVNEVGSWVQVDRASGWRGVRAWLSGTDDASVALTITLEFARTVTWAAGVPTVAMATLTFPHGDLNADVPQSFVPADPGIEDATFYARLVVTSAADSYDLSYIATICPSRRCDRPLPWPVPATDGTVVEGGTRASALADPTDSLNYYETSGTSQAGVTGSYLVRFASLPSTGLWTNNPLGQTQGDKDFRFNTQDAALGIGGKPFFARGAVGAPTTITLSSVAITSKVIASGGTSVTQADTTHGSFLFGSVTVGAAGTYRVWMRGRVNGSAVFKHGHQLGLWASLTDPYCYETVDAELHAPVYFFSTIVARTDTPPGSPAAGARYVIGDSPTGVWMGRAGQLAVFDADRLRWRYLDVPTPMRIAATTGTVGHHRDASGTWHTDADNYLELDVVMPAAGTFYVRLGIDDPHFIEGIEHPFTRWLAVTMGWDAV